MTEKEIRTEAYLERLKKPDQLVEDIIREANDKRDNLDLIKHLIKRLAIHQVNLETQASKTNRWLLILTLVSTFAAVISLISIFIKHG